MSPAKADMSIAAEYVVLAGKNRAHVFDAIRTEYDRALAGVLAITGEAGLLDEDAVLKRSLDRHRPYLDSLNQIRTVAHARYRARGDRVWLDPVLRSLNAIAAGMRNTG